MHNFYRFFLLLLLGQTNFAFAHEPGGPQSITMQCPPNTTLNVGPFVCTAPFTYNVTADDTNPGNILISQTVGLASGSDFPLGATLNTFTALNESTGESSSCSFTVTVLDNIAPTVVCNEAIVVAIGIDVNSDCYNGGIAIVSANTLDNGTYDNCNDFLLTVRRLPPYSDCINALSHSNSHQPCDPAAPDSLSEYQRAIGEADNIRFYCCEVDSDQTIVIRAYQLNPDNSIATRPDGDTIYNDCYTQVHVLDKLKPVCAPPPNVTVSCENFDPTLATYGTAVTYDNCCLSNSTTTVSYAQFDSLCSRGTITRTFRAYDCHDNTSSCVQRIVVEYNQNYFVKFPDDVYVTDCSVPPGNNFGEPGYFGKDCELLTSAYADELFYIVPDACIKIERTWNIINWCTYNPAMPLTSIPNPNPKPVNSDPENLVGPIVSDCNTTGPWAPSIVKIHPSAPDPTNFCTFFDANTNGYTYKQIIRILDSVDPVFSDCPTMDSTILDQTLNDSLLWHNSYLSFSNPVDLSEVETDLKISATDACYATRINMSYQLFMDLDQNNVFETVIRSAALPPADTVYYGNSFNVGFAGGTPKSFDDRPVPYNQKWRFALETSVAGDQKTAAVRWNTLQDPTTYVKPQLPAGKYKIKWFVSDDCGNESTCESFFTIKATTLTGLVYCPADTVLNTAAFTCSAPLTYNVTASDSDPGPLVITQTSGQPSGTLYLLGQTVNTFQATNTSTGHTATCSFTVTVEDIYPPVAICDDTTTVVIGFDDPNDCFAGGVAYVHAAAFDDGSHDNCAQVGGFTVRRLPPYSACISALNPVNGHPDCNDTSPDVPSEYASAIAENDTMKFYCCEIGAPQRVLFKAYLLNADGSKTIGPDGLPVFSECETVIYVEDHLKPICIAPADVSVSCTNFDPTFTAYGMATAEDNCCLAGVTLISNYALFDSACSRGTIFRRFTASDCNGNTSQCTQRIIAAYTQDYFIHFPNDAIITNCVGNIVDSIYGKPQFFGEDCELLAFVYQDEIISVVPDACYKVNRKWTVINWCTYDPGLPFIAVPNPTPNVMINHPANLPGPTVSSCNTQGPWAPTIVKINPTDQDATNYCTFFSLNANGYTYTQVIKVIDAVDPVYTDCPAAEATIADSTANDPFLWHAVFNPANPSQDWSETAVDQHISANDLCSGKNVDMRYLLYMDLDGNGLFETVVNSENLPPADTVYYNNGINPPFLGGTPVAFDNRPVPYNQKWRFALQTTTSGNQKTAALRWNTLQDPNTYVVPQLPQGLYKVRWFTDDACGNESICEHVFTVLPTTVVGVNEPKTAGFVLYQNVPNPLNDHTVIGFELPESCDATLSVFDQEGREIYRNTAHYPSGNNAVELKDQFRDLSGVLYYRLQTDKHSAVKR